MKFYFISWNPEEEDAVYEYFTSIKKAKYRINYLKKNRDDYRINYLGETIFYTHVEPTKKGILRALNAHGGGIPVEGGE